MDTHTYYKTHMHTHRAKHVQFAPCIAICTWSEGSDWVEGIAILNFQSVSPSNWSVRMKQDPFLSVVLNRIISAGILWSCNNNTYPSSNVL